jgi:hypothetical protein
MTFARLTRYACWLALIVLCFAAVAMAQTETATISGLITDDSGAVVPGVEVKLQSVDRGSVTSATTNNAGIYVFASVHPGQYQLTVHKAGFKQVDFLGLIINVQDHIEQNFRLQVGSVAESVTVEASAATINTTDATVSTVVDRQFAENLPLNGRSFQTLIQLTPGVVLVPSNSLDGGQFSVNGQRAASNYWMVDGVSANIGTSPTNNPGNGLGGSLGSFSVLGGTNSLVSVDAMQEFRIQTSTFAPEFGRTPGGQISILTRSGTNQFHGTLFDYFRNNVLDANDWFNGVNILNSTPLPKSVERQNDFGGTFEGPILKDKTFFFFSYEGLRLQLPQTTLTTVPDLNARQNAIPAIQPFLNAFPFDPNQPDLGNGIAQFNASYSNPATLDAYSLRIDHRLNSKLALFGRYDYSPSQLVQRGLGAALSRVFPAHITTQTATIGATWMISSTITNETRFNYSRVDGSSSSTLDTFGGAVPLTSLPFPSPFTSRNSSFGFDIFSLAGGDLSVGANLRNLQRQFNVVDNISIQRGSHNLKFGVDFRRLSPLFSPITYSQFAAFSDVPSAAAGNLSFSFVTSGVSATFLFRNLGAFAQDTWRIAPRLTLTYGLRWDVDFAPSSLNGPEFPALTSFNLATVALAPPGTPAFKTPYGNVAPRIGVAYQLSTTQDWETVLRGGFGVYYDFLTQEVGNNVGSGYPFLASTFVNGGTFPLSSATAAAPIIAPPNAVSGTLVGFDPHLQEPYTLEWNVTVEQGLGKQQSLSTSYIGAAGRRLIQSAQIFSPNSNYAEAVLVGNTATSDYNALQTQFQRRLLHGLQALASYTWSHSIDTGSAGSFGNLSNVGVPTLNENANRGPSDFDIRNSFSAGITYDVPAFRINPVADAILRGWSLQSVIQARSAPPVNVDDSVFSTFLNGVADIRPDRIPGVPLYLNGPQYPGGKAINFTPGAVAGGCSNGQPSVGPFCPPPTDSNGNPLRQGNLGRNALRGFGATQWDFAVHRDFPIHELLKLQFRAEIFNLLNHPNFGQPVGDINNPQFGLSTQMLGRSLGGSNVGGGGFDPLYQIGGPRSVQLALKLSF